jgi:FtsH-binding integral membrane protein
MPSSASSIPAEPWLQRARTPIRIVAALASTAVAILYVAIGIGGLVRPEDVAPSPGSGGLLYFGVAAAISFVIGAVLLAAVDRRVLWIVGAAFQLVGIVAYNALASQRATPFEFWGLLLEALQVVILASLVALAYGRDERAQARD